MITCGAPPVAQNASPWIIDVVNACARLLCPRNGLCRAEEIKIENGDDLLDLLPRSEQRCPWNARFSHLLILMWLLSRFQALWNQAAPTSLRHHSQLHILKIQKWCWSIIIRNPDNNVLILRLSLYLFNLYRSSFLSSTLHLTHVGCHSRNRLPCSSKCQ